MAQYSRAKFVTKHLRVQIQKAGGWYKARWAGRAEFVFGQTAEEAVARLRTGK